MSVGTGVLEELSALVDRLVDVDPVALGDGDSLVALHRELERLTAVTTRAAAAFDAGSEWDDNARSAASWLSGRCDTPGATSRARVRLGRALRHLPVAEAAWLAGEVGEAQVMLLVRARTPGHRGAHGSRRGAACSRGEAASFTSFARAVAYWRWRADPDGAEDDAAAQRERRKLHLSQSFGAMWFLDGTFDPISGEIVAAELRRIEEELFAADWSEAKARVGTGVRPGDLRRSPAQRRADALVEMATRSATAPVGGRRPEPLFTVLVGYETFAGPVCELANGTMVTPRQPGALAGPGVGGAGGLRRTQPSDRRGRAPAPVQRCHPPGGRGA